MTLRHIALIAGFSYLAIFFAAVYANFFVLDALLQNPLGTVRDSALQVRLGALAFIVAAAFDVVVAWALFGLFKEHVLTRLSTYFRIMHAALMGIAVAALPPVLALSSKEAILSQVEHFNTMWLIGLVFFGVHLLLLGWIIRRHVRIIPYLLVLAGVMYILDTSAQFLLPYYDAYADVFLLTVAVPAIAGEMSFTLWLLFKGGKTSPGGA